MYCSFCGKENNSKLNYCVYCGKKLLKETDLNMQQKTTKTSPEYLNKPNYSQNYDEKIVNTDYGIHKANEPRKKSSLPIFIGISIAVIGLLLTSAIFISNRMNKNEYKDEYVASENVETEMENDYDLDEDDFSEDDHNFDSDDTDDSIETDNSEQDYLVDENDSEIDSEENSDDEYVIAYSSEYELDKSDIKGMSAQQLNYAKNEIYARHGRMFDSNELRQYFNSKSWYSPKYTPDEFSEIESSEFSSIEKKNIRFLVKYEKKRSETGDGYRLDQ